MRNIQQTFLTASLAGALALSCLFTWAATVPKGVQLHAEQTLIRNNGSEPETLDPSLIESVGAANLTRDLFEGLTSIDAQAKSYRAWPKSGGKSTH